MMGDQRTRTAPTESMRLSQVLLMGISFEISMKTFCTMSKEVVVRDRRTKTTENGKPHVLG